MIHFFIIFKSVLYKYCILLYYTYRYQFRSFKIENVFCIRKFWKMDTCAKKTTQIPENCTLRGECFASDPSTLKALRRIYGFWNKKLEARPDAKHRVNFERPYIELLASTVSTKRKYTLASKASTQKPGGVEVNSILVSLNREFHTLNFLYFHF